MSTSIRIEVVAGSAIVIGARRIESGAGLIFAASLRLALEPTRSIPRFELRELLWPSADAPTGANRLRWLLAKLRGLGVPIRTNTSTVSLADTNVAIDVDDLGGCDPSRVGEVLRGYHPTFSAPFAAWLDEQRSVLASRAIRQLVQRLNASLELGDSKLALDLAAAVQRLDPLNPSAALAAAEAKCRLGAREEAVEGLERFIEETESSHLGEQVQARLFLRRIRTAGNIGNSQQPRFVGRTNQLRRLDSFLAAARAQQGGAIVVAGPAGIGKTRLLDEARARAAVSGMQTARISCQSVDLSRPLAGVADLATQLIKMRGAAGTDPEHLDLLNNFVSTRRALQPRPATDHALAQSMRIRLVGALLDLLGAISMEAPLLIELDDAQWIDPSLEWLWQSLFGWSKSRAVAWLFAIRNTGNNDNLFGLQPMRVGSLELDFASELVDDVASKTDHRMSLKAREKILARAAGNPLFVQELARQLISTGSVDHLPTTLTAVIDNGLRALSPQALRTLQLAALLGTHATLVRMESMGALPPADFVEALVELEANGILTIDRVGAAYGHVLWAESALAQLAPSIAFVLHRRAAERFEFELASQPSAVLIWEAARHWEFGGDSERVRTAIARGAEHLFANGFPNEAANLYERAVRGITDLPQQAALRRKGIDCLFAAGRWTDLVRAIDEHEALASELDTSYDRHNELELRRLDAENSFGVHLKSIERPLHCVRNHHCSPSHRLHAARQAAKLADVLAPELLVEIHNTVATIRPRNHEDWWNLIRVQYFYEKGHGDIRLMRPLAEELVSRSRKILSHQETARALIFVGTACRIAGDFADARRAFGEAISIGKRWGSVEIPATAYDHSIGLSLEVDAPAVTRRLMDEARSSWREFAGFGSEVMTEITEPGHEANLAVIEGRYVEALRLATPLDRCLACPIPVWRVRLLAAHLAARLALSMTDALTEITASMAPAFARPGDWMDWPATVYAEYVSRYEGHERSSAFVTHYIDHIRRELYPAPSALRAFLSNNVMGVEVAGPASP
ncbi:MAG TPA: ATP-binding protein [Gemmatimonadaceae bacterium]|nr:ATP-binding protein [Gemmatimonadaceae bacterium]